MSATPVLIWQDLPLAVRIPDTERPDGTVVRRPPPHMLRCFARTRGDTAIASMNDVPLDGGYRCQFRSVKPGLCWRHWLKANPEVKARAEALWRDATGR